MAKNLLVKIIGDASSLTRELRKAESGTTGFGLAANKMKIAAAGAATGGVALLGKELLDSVKAAQEAQVSQNKMKNQLNALNISYKAHAAQIENVIQKTSQLAGLDDEDLQDAFTGLVRTTGDVNSALRDTALAADIARGKGIELEAATMIVTKAQLGMVGSLRRQGIEIPPVTAAVDALKASKEKYTVAEMEAAKQADLTATKQAAIAALQDKFAGSAETYGKTAAGAQDRFRVATENLQEAIGTVLLPVLTRLFTQATELTIKLQRDLGPAATQVKEAISKLAAGVDAAMPVLRVASAVAIQLRLALLTVRVAAAAVDLAVTGAQHAINGLKAAFDAVLAAGKTAAGWLTGAGEAAFKALKGAASGIAGIVNSIANALEAVASAARAAAGAIRDVISIAGKIPHIGLPHIPNPFHRAAGGPVSAGASYIVGEHGPELFSPGASGFVTPNHMLGGGTAEIHTHLYLDGKQIAETVQKQFLRKQRSSGSLGFV